MVFTDRIFERDNLAFASLRAGLALKPTNQALNVTLADLLLDRDTERSRAWWVNRPDESELDRALWVPEPLRWLGVATGRRLIGVVDAAERRDSPLAPAALKLMEWLFP